MTERDYQDAAETIARIGKALDQLGLPEVQRALATETKRLRRKIRRETYPVTNAWQLLELADELEKLVDILGTRKA